MKDVLIDLALWVPDQRFDSIEALILLTKLKLVKLHDSEQQMLAREIYRWTPAIALRTLHLLHAQGYLGLSGLIEAAALRNDAWLNRELQQELPKWKLEPRVQARLLAALQQPTVDLALAATG